MTNLKPVFAIMTALIFLNGAAAFAENTSALDQQTVIAQLKKQSALPILFPDKIPPAATHGPYLFADSYGIHPNDSQFWQLSVGTTPDCHGVHFCTVGFISAEKNGTLHTDYHSLPGNKDHRKEPVELKNNITAYYTPFHIQASGVNPTLEWRIKDILYTLSWRIQGNPAKQKQVLIEMANSTMETLAP